MPVAKSFQSFVIKSEPFIANNRTYIIVQNPKTGTERTVRWYDDKEYNKLYPDTPVEKTLYKNLKHCLGFDKGYITIYKNSDQHEDWFMLAPTRYHRLFGWYLVSTDEDLVELPANVSAHKLYWSDISSDNETLDSDKEVLAQIDRLFYPENESNQSQHIGTVGERLSLDVKISDIKKITTKWGEKINYYMEDIQGNIYLWFTSPRDLQISKYWACKGTVKEHIIEKNKKITVLTRCMERK